MGILRSSGYKIINENEEKGMIEAILDYKNQFSIIFVINFDKNKQSINIIIENTINSADKKYIEYYTFDDYNGKYEDYFYHALYEIKKIADREKFKFK